MKTSTTSEKLSSASNDMQIEAKDISVVFGSDTVLEDVSFVINKGDFIGLVGQNGSGKTTLLRVLLGLLKPSKGEAINDGATVGYVPQRGQLYSAAVPISVMEVVLLGSKGNREKAAEALSSVSMEKFEKRNFNELSGGQQQRVVIAKALASGADILILDEPTTGVDEKSKADFYALLHHLHSEGKTIIMVSHDLDSVVGLVSRVIYLHHTIKYDGPPDKFDMNFHAVYLDGVSHDSGVKHV